MPPPSPPASGQQYTRQPGIADGSVSIDWHAFIGSKRAESAPAYVAVAAPELPQPTAVSSVRAAVAASGGDPRTRQASRQGRPSVWTSPPNKFGLANSIELSRGKKFPGRA